MNLVARWLIVWGFSGFISCSRWPPCFWGHSGRCWWWMSTGSSVCWPSQPGQHHQSRKYGFHTPQVLAKQLTHWPDVVLVLGHRLRRIMFALLISIVWFTLTVVNDFRRFLSQFSTNFHEILHTLFFIHVVTTLKVSRSFNKYFRSYTLWHTVVNK